MKGLLLLSFLFAFALSQEENCTFPLFRESRYVNRFLVDPARQTVFGFPTVNYANAAPPNSNGLLDPDEFAIRWDGQIVPPETGNYMLLFGADDGFRIFINGNYYCGLWGVKSFSVAPSSCPVLSLTQGVPIDIVIEYFELGGRARIEAGWRTPSSGGQRVLMPESVAQVNLCVDKFPQIDSFTPFNPTTRKGSVSVSLNERPISNVFVELESECAIFQNCTLTFSPTNYDVSQVVQIMSDLRNERTCCEVRVTAVSGDPDFVGDFDNVTICSGQITGRAMGHSYGDPHITTFDGVRHDFFDVGDFYLARTFDGNFAVQARQTPCAAASCNTAAGIKYGSAFFFVYMDQNGIPTPATRGDLAANGMTVESEANGYVISMTNGIVVGIRVGLWQARNIYYLGINVRVPASLQGVVAGLLGLYDEDPSNDYFMPNGNVSPVLSVFQHSWAVPDAENLFLMQEMTVISPILSGQGDNFVVDPTFKDCPEVEAPSPFSNTTIDNSTNPVELRNVTCEVPTQLSLDVCDPVFNGTAAMCCKDLGVPADDFYLSCICDTILTDSPDFAFDAINSFFQACDSMAAKLGKSCDTCPSDCNGRGICEMGVCKCDPGFQGDACEQDTTTPPTIVDVDPKEAAALCPTNFDMVTVKGTGFFPDSELACLFGVVAVTATRITNEIVTCPVPSVPSLPSVVDIRVSRLGAPSNSLPITFYESCCLSPCENGGTCTDEGMSFTCSCPLGFIGDICGDDDPCVPNPCQNGGTCDSDSNGAVECECGPAFLGDFCETSNPCFSDPCQNGGTCSLDASGYICECPDGFDGLDCQTNIDDCDPNPCLNGGQCVDGIDSFSCDCSMIAFEGPLCENPTNCPDSPYQGGVFNTTGDGEYSPLRCPPGSVPQVERLCEGGSFGMMNITCKALNTCVADSFGNAMWPRAFSGLVYGICQPGYSGEPSRECMEDGTWSTSLSNPCQRNRCNAVTEDNSDWPSSNSLTTVSGNCINNFQGSPTRECQADGTYGPIKNRCISPVFCPTETANNAVFPLTSGGETAMGTCVDGYNGNPTRACSAAGVWGTVMSPCQLNQCAPVTEANATWPATDAYTRVFGNCLVGGGRPFRDCQEDGTFGPIFGSCQICEPEFFGRADWPETSGGTSAVGQCEPGWTGKPIRNCRENGEWDAYLSTYCTRLYCNAVSDGVHSFQRMEAGTQAYGRCLQGTGRPWRRCNINGVFEAIQNPCKL